ncbi:exonuclease SbcCD subunit D [Cellulosilyticum ruminicola]|uniref:exonuclease SbcCD subunit D n=1 Tax=Cellulosilyticum ruminicola TaxID=425254 RepID=UPI0006D1B930|nr:exonuclease SbcCD subunit D [Cellulosilyticum ruminicola]
MKILHTSDWHLGRSLGGFSLIEDQRYILEQILETIEREKVDVLIIAGDIYDRSIPSEEAVELFNEFLSKVVLEHKIYTIAIAGNHDSEERIDFGSKLFENQNLYIVGKSSKGYEKLQVTVSNECIDVFLVPYIEPSKVREIAGDENIKRHDEAMAYLVGEMKKEKTENPSIVVAHAFVTGGEVSDSERRLSVVGGAEFVNAENFKDFTYTALGHLHKRQAMGRNYIRYSGSLLKYSISEANQPKGYVLLDVDQKGNLEIEEKSFNVLRDVRILKGSVEEIIAASEVDEHKDDYVYAKLTGNYVHDVTARLRHIYPYILGSEWVAEENKANTNTDDYVVSNTDFLKTKERTITEVFMEFLNFVGETDFEADEIEMIEEIVKEVEEEKNEA